MATKVGENVTEDAARFLAEAKSLAAELQRLESESPSAQLYLSLAIEYAATTAPRLEALARAIAQAPEAGRVQMALRRLKRSMVAGPGYPWPAKAAGRLFPGASDLEAECARFQTHPLELQALAVWQLVKEDPGRFTGTITDPAAHTHRIADLRRDRARILTVLAVIKDRLAAQLADIQAVLAQVGG